MIKYAKIINEITGLCEVGIGTDDEFYISIGLEEMDVQQSDIDGAWYLTEKCPMKTEEELTQTREDAFNKEFFNTSLGYIRRKVTMANGDVRDFLSDLLPTIAMGIQLNQPVTIICYYKPDFSADVTNWEKYQHAEAATAQFVQECFMQLNKDFTGIDNLE